MDYFSPHGDAVSVFDVCHAYQLLEANYNVGGWVRERPSNQRRRESIGCQLARIGYSDLYRTVDLWISAEAAAEETEISSDDESVRFVYFKKVLEWGLPIEDDDRAAIERLFTTEAIEQWAPNYFPVPPWRPVFQEGEQILDVKWRLERPVNDGAHTHCDSQGAPLLFDGYAEAQATAAQLNQELNASNDTPKPHEADVHPGT